MTSIFVLNKLGWNHEKAGVHVASFTTERKAEKYRDKLAKKLGNHPHQYIIFERKLDPEFKED